MMKKFLIASLAVVISTSAFAEENGISDEEAKVLITKFYNSYVLIDSAENHNSLDKITAPNWGTSKFINKLKNDYDYDCEDNDCYGVYALRTGAQDGEGTSSVINVTPRSNGWYRINYRDMGWKGVTDVKIVNLNGVPKLDDYKFVSSNVK